MDEDLLAQLDDETKKRLREGNIAPEELEALGLPPEMFGLFADGEEGEAE